jgi:UDP-glucose 4-epimerase
MEADPGKVVLVTGASGFIGRHLISRLLHEKYRVRALVRGPAALGPGVELVTGDARDLDVMRRAVRGAGTIYHLAGRAHDFGEERFNHMQYDVSVGSALALTTALGDDATRRLVFMSSVAVYPAGSDTAHREDGPLDPQSAYGGAKLLAERMFFTWGAAHGAHVTALRPALVFGAGCPGNLDRLMRATLAGRVPRLPTGTAPRAMVHVQDLVEACLLVARNDEANGRAFNVADGESYVSSDIVDFIVGAQRRPRAPMSVLRAAARVGDAMERVTGRSAPISGRLLDRLFGPSRVSTERLVALGFEPRHTLWSALPGMLAALEAA